MRDYNHEGLFRLFEIAKQLGLCRKLVAKKIKYLELVPTDKWYFNEYQIDLIRECEIPRKAKEEIYESKINYKSCNNK